MLIFVVCNNYDKNFNINEHFSLKIGLIDPINNDFFNADLIFIIKLLVTSEV